jgi:protein arginine kinase activator
MKCELCKKHSATIHIQEIVNGQKKSLHICTECAAEKAQDNPVLQGINLAEMLYNISGHLGNPESESDDEGSVSEQEKGAATGIACPTCGWDTAKFRKTGRLGCTECYKVFHEILCDALKAMHRGTLHVGRRPEATDHGETGKIMLEILELQREIEEHVRREEYEKAAVLRDRIGELRQKTMLQVQGKEA